MLTLKEIELFVVENLTYTDIWQVGNTLEVMFNRENGQSLALIKVVDDIAKVIELYRSQELSSPISKRRRFKSFKRLQSFLELLSASCIEKKSKIEM